MTGVEIETDISLRNTAFDSTPSVYISWYGQSRATDLSIHLVSCYKPGDVSLSGVRS